MTKYVEVNAKGGGYTEVFMDGEKVSQHSSEREVAEALINLKFANPEADIEARQAMRVVPALTAAGRALLVDTPDPDPQPDPDPDPDPDPEPDPDPPVDPPQAWSAYREIPDPSVAMGFDVFQDFSQKINETFTGDRGVIAITQSGTPGNPRVVDVRNANCRQLGVSGSHVVVLGRPDQKLVRTTGEGPVRSQGRNVVFIDIDVGGNNTDHGHGSAVVLGPNNLWLRGVVHNFGVLNTSEEQDQHGFKVTQDDNYIIDVETYALSGDGVQVGDATRANPSRCYIGGGYHHDNRENAIDIKDSRDVVVSGVRMANFVASSSSPGEALIIHDDAYNAKILDCIVRNARLGMVSSGKSGHQIYDNDIVATAVGIQLRNTRPIRVQGNTIVAPQRIQVQGGMSHPDTIIQS